MILKSFKEINQATKRHGKNILIATNVIEEGIDIGSCNMIIRFSNPPNFCSYIQSKV